MSRIKVTRHALVLEINVFLNDIFFSSSWIWILAQDTESILLV